MITDENGFPYKPDDSHKSCPFCDHNQIRIDRRSRRAGGSYTCRVEHHTYSVRCQRCHARGPAVGGDVVVSNCDSPPPDTVTDETLRSIALAHWNNRIRRA